MFPSQVGTPSDASHVRRSFRPVVEGAGLNPGEWTPRERSRLAPDAAPLVAVDTGRYSRRRLKETQVTQMSRPIMCAKCDGAGFAALIGPLYVKCRRCKGEGEIDSFGARVWWLIRVLLSQKG